MTNEQILKKVIEKAIENGWDNKIFWFNGDDIACGNYYQMLLNHDFAKAFWKGEKCTCLPDYDEEMNRYHKPNCEITTPGWRRHLQTIVLEKDPLKYLAKFL